MTMRNTTNLIRALVLSVACMSQYSSASVIDAFDVAVDPETCDLFNVTLTSISVHADPSTDLLENPGGSVGEYTANDCAGVYDGNDNVPITDNNIGVYGSNLLNGGNEFFTGYEFIDPEEDLQNLDDDTSGDPTNRLVYDTNRDDPGWIHLAKFDAETENVGYSDIYTTSISTLLNLSFECTSGTGFGDCTAFNWTLTTDEDIVQNATDLIGESTFDHLAFSIKSTAGFAVYDLNFKSIFQDEVADGNLLFGQPEAFKTAFILGGTIEMEDFQNKKGKWQGISHLNVFARDPVEPSTSIPEPSTLAIFGLSLMLLSVRRKQA